MLYMAYANTSSYVALYLYCLRLRNLICVLSVQSLSCRLINVSGMNFTWKMLCVAYFLSTYDIIIILFFHVTREDGN